MSAATNGVTPNSDGSSTNPPRAEIFSNVNLIRIDQTVEISILLNEESTDFSESDIKINGGILLNFSGSNRIYTAQVLSNDPPSDPKEIKIEIPSGSFSNKKGVVNANDELLTLKYTKEPDIRPTLDWLKQVGSNYNDSGQALTITKNEEVYIAGNTGTYSNFDGEVKLGFKDAFLSKYSADGNRLWTRLFGSATNGEDATAISTDSNGFIYMTGNTGSIQYLYDKTTYGDGSDGFLTKFDPSGNMVWTNIIGTNTYDSVEAIAIAPDDSLYITGQTDVKIDGKDIYAPRESFIQKYDSAGNKIWTRTIGLVSNGTFATDILFTSLGEVFIAGTLRKDSTTKAFIAKYNVGGELIWNSYFGDNLSGICLTEGTEGEILLSGTTPSGELDGQIVSGNSAAYISSFSSDGIKNWTRLVNGFNVQPTDLCTDNEGNIYMSGFGYGLNWTQYDRGLNGFIAKFERNGNLIWIEQFDTITDDSANAVGVNSNGDIYTTGKTSGSFPGWINSADGKADVFLAKLDQPTDEPAISLNFNIRQKQNSASLPPVKLISKDLALVSDINGRVSIENFSSPEISINIQTLYQNPEQLEIQSKAITLKDAVSILKLAADFDGSGTVSLADAIGVLRHAVGLQAPAPSWVFIEEGDDTSPSALNPGIPGPVTVEVTPPGPIEVNLIGILRGDVDGSYGVYPV
jgi:hypothetical protein